MISGLGRFPGEGNGNPLQYSCLKNPMGRGDWWLQSTGGKELDMNEQLTLSHSMLSKKEKQFSPFPNLREKAFSVSLPSMMLVV